MVFSFYHLNSIVKFLLLTIFFSFSYTEQNNCAQCEMWIAGGYSPTDHHPTLQSSLSLWSFLASFRLPFVFVFFSNFTILVHSQQCCVRAQQAALINPLYATCPAQRIRGGWTEPKILKLPILHTTFIQSISFCAHLFIFHQRAELSQNVPMCRKAVHY